MSDDWHEMVWYGDVLWSFLFGASILGFWFFVSLELPRKNAQDPRWWWLDPKNPPIRAALGSLRQLVSDRGLGWLLDTWLLVVLFVILWFLISPTLCQRPWMHCS